MPYVIEREDLPLDAVIKCLQRISAKAVLSPDWNVDVNIRDQSVIRIGLGQSSFLIGLL